MPGLASLLASASDTTSDALPATPSATERRARAAALRGFLLAGQQRYRSAECAFVEAATLDPSLDLADDPAFWTLQRAGHETVARAYEAVGRDWDARLLRDRLDRTFRPKLLTSRAPVRT